MLTPSSNTVLEPCVSAMLADVAPGTTAHFARFPVTEISLEDAALGQFDIETMLAAARLLADARVDAIAWNGTSGGWLGLEADRALCAAITEETGVPATTATLALVEAFRGGGIARFALVTPYLDAIQARIVATLEGEGLSCVAERHLNRKDNFAFAEVTAEAIAEMCRQVAVAAPQAIAIYCTNLRGAPLAAGLEDELGTPVTDSVSVTVRDCLRLCGVSPTGAGWGSLFT
jgi:maleate isomerase